MQKLFIFVNLFALIWAAIPSSAQQAARIHNAVSAVQRNIHSSGTSTQALLSSAQHQIANALSSGTCSYHASGNSLDGSLRQLFCTLKNEVPNGEGSLEQLLQVLRSDGLFPRPRFGRIGIVITPDLAFRAILSKFSSISGYSL